MKHKYLLQEIPHFLIVKFLNKLSQLKNNFEVHQMSIDSYSWPPALNLWSGDSSSTSIGAPLYLPMYFHDEKKQTLGCLVDGNWLIMLWFEKSMLWSDQSMLWSEKRSQKLTLFFQAFNALDEGSL
jgi:hypothetical protein